MTLLSVATLLVLVLDPFGNIPLYLMALAQIPARRRWLVALRELFIALVVLVIFLFGGRYLLPFLQISEPSLSVGGGMVLLLISIGMVFGRSQEILSGPEGEPLIVTLAIPAVAGPSAIATVLLLAAREPGRLGEWLLALVTAWFISAVILSLSIGLNRFFGQRGLVALERLSGMILTVVAVQMLLDGIKAFLQ